MGAITPYFCQDSACNFLKINEKTVGVCWGGGDGSRS